MDAKKILIIDDEFAVRYLVERHLARHHFEVFLARDGESGLKMARQCAPELIVLDINLPDVSGFCLYEQLQQDPMVGDVPIIFLTSMLSAEHKQRAFSLGANDYIEKPFMPDEFLSRITAVLSTSQQSTNTHIKQGHVTVFYGPKGGVGTTTLAVQFSETVVIHSEQPVILLDLAIPLGGIAPLLNLYTQHHILNLLAYPENQLSVSSVQKFAQQHHSNLYVVPAPGQFYDHGQQPDPTRLCALLNLITSAGFEVVIDLGSRLVPLTVAALRRADTIFTITSGQTVSNKMVNAFIKSADYLRLHPNRIMPVVNELHGYNDQIEIDRMPVAKVPHVQERSRTRLWLQENGLRKMLTIAL